MNVQDFIDYLRGHPDEFECESNSEGGSIADTGFLVRNKRYKTVTHFTPEAVGSHSREFLLSQTIHGKNVDHITRVTGYFSKVSGWNKGKVSELQDRYRSGIEE
ncbi:MAG: anaerobic ribonucleoside-triphosphate reductase [Candidatus Desantisbacteria bacterium]